MPCSRALCRSSSSLVCLSLMLASHSSSTARLAFTRRLRSLRRSAFKLYNYRVHGLKHIGMAWYTYGVVWHGMGWYGYGIVRKRRKGPVIFNFLLNTCSSFIYCPSCCVLPCESNSRYITRDVSLPLLTPPL